MKKRILLLYLFFMLLGCERGEWVNQCVGWNKYRAEIDDNVPLFTNEAYEYFCDCMYTEKMKYENECPCKQFSEDKEAIESASKKCSLQMIQKIKSRE